MNKDYHKISPTAVTCARARDKYTDMPYADKIAREVTQEKESKVGITYPILKLISQLFPNLIAQVSQLEGRYLSTNDAIRKLGDYSVLEIAAGLSTRSLEFAKGDLLYVETDLPDMIGIKESIVKDIRAKEGLSVYKDHHFHALNSLNLEEMIEAGELMSSIEGKKPIAVIHEGLVPYLTREEQTELRNNIRYFLQNYSPNGAWITTDFSGHGRKENIFVKIAKRKIEKSTGRKFTKFASHKEVKEFLSAGNLKGELLPNDHLVDKLSCIGKARLNPKKVRELAKDYQAYFITLK